MPQVVGRCQSAELPVNQEEALCLAIRVHLEELCQRLPNIYRHKEQLDDLISDKEQFQLLTALADVLDLQGEGYGRQQPEQQQQIQEWSQMLVQALIDSSVQMRCTRFYELLENNGFTSAVDLLQMQENKVEGQFFNRLAEFYTSQKMDCSAAKMGRFSSNEFLIALVDFQSLTEQDVETVENGAGDLGLLKILTKKCNDWCSTFVLALIFVNFKDDLDLLLPGFDEFVQSKHNQTINELHDNLQSEADNTQVREIVHDAVQEFLVANHRFTDSNADMTAVSDIVINGDTEKDHEVAAAAAAAAVKESSFEETEPEVKEAQECSRQHLRMYQQELAKAGMNGANCVIIAPTGSGKTLVSIEIARALLKRNGNAKIAFLADRTQLVDQQHAAFDEQLKPNYKVNLQRGGGVDKFPLRYSIKDFSVHILSTQILLNSLKDESEDGLAGDVSQFQLLIFDECHHCDKEHPAKKIMDFYFEFKEKHGADRLPQVVGLTASPGTGNAYKLDEAVNHIMKICANLDCQQLVTVRDSEHELQQHVSDPSVQLHKVEAKENDVVVEAIEQLMIFTEQKLEAVAVEANIPLKRAPSTKGDFIYTNFCGDLPQQFLKFRDESSKAVYSCWRCLNACNIAHSIGSLFRSTDAVKYIEDHLMSDASFRTNPTCTVDAEIRKEINKQFNKMQEYCTTQQQAASSSPALQKLADLLLEQFTMKPDSRVIVFVQQRLYTLAVNEFIQSSTCSELINKGIRSAVMTGANAAGEAGGITQNEQTEILKDFKRGIHKILISTSVSEEGLDVEKCNMVVRFCHVTNEIAMVQSKGRGRAEDSTYHVIVPPQLNWLQHKERTNQLRDQFMRTAVIKISNMTADEFIKKVQHLQQEHQHLMEQRRITQREQAEANAAEVWNLLCVRCHRHLSDSTRIRIAQDCHHLCLDAEMLNERLRMSKTNEERRFTDYVILGISLLCQCGHKVANLCKYKELLYPEILVQSLVFVNVKCETRKSAKKWKLTNKFMSLSSIKSNEMIEWARIQPDIDLDSIEMIKLDTT